MKKVTAAWQQINRKIDGLWERSPDHPADLFFVLLMGVFLFYLAWILPFKKENKENLDAYTPYVEQLCDSICSQYGISIY